jgi:hypothetical protein
VHNSEVAHTAFYDNKYGFLPAKVVKTYEINKKKPDLWKSRK